jgi:acyl-ACP thioesterase
MDYVGRPLEGRTFGAVRRVRLSDADPEANLRVDAVARYLQDVATDDWNDSGIDTDDVWVARRTSWRRRAGRAWPVLYQEVSLTTWCGGTGAAWAERRTDVSLDGDVVIEAASLWVPVGPHGRPRRVRQEFLDVYGGAAAGRRVPGRVAPPELDRSARGRPWALRRSDIDVVGHVNNAAVWFAVAEVVAPGARSVTVTHHGALEAHDEVTLYASDGRLWLVVGTEVRVSGEFEVG